MTIGQRIKSLREARALSQRELATRAGFSNQAVKLWEDGVHEPMPRAIRAVAAALEVPVADILGNEPMPADDPAQPATTETEQPAEVHEL